MHQTVPDSHSETFSQRGLVLLKTVSHYIAPQGRFSAYGSTSLPCVVSVICPLGYPTPILHQQYQNSESRPKTHHATVARCRFQSRHPARLYNSNCLRSLLALQPLPMTQVHLQPRRYIVHMP